MEELKKQLKALTAARSESNVLLKQLLNDQIKQSVEIDIQIVELGNKVLEVGKKAIDQVNGLSSSLKLHELKMQEKQGELDEVRQLNIDNATIFTAFLQKQNKLLGGSCDQAVKSHLN